MPIGRVGMTGLDASRATRISDGYTHLRRMLKSIEFALPVKATEVPNGPDWLHEVKHDGYRMQVIRERDRVRLKTMGGHDCTKRYPWIVEAALKLKRIRFVLDGEAVVLNLHGISDFDALHSGRYNQRCSSTPSTCWRMMVTIFGGSD